MAPASTPNEIVERLNKEINAALQEPDVGKARRPVHGAGRRLARRPAQLHEAELTVMTPIIKRSGATAD